MSVAEYPFGRATETFYLGHADPLPGGVPLLAYGANASPDALAAKLPDTRVAALAGTLHGYAVVHSAHVSPYGAVPATIVPAAPEHREPVHVLLMGAERGRLDATEPNYRRLRLDGVELTVDRLGRLGSVEAYVSRHGPLVVDGAPVPLGARPQEELRVLLRRPPG